MAPAGAAAAGGSPEGPRARAAVLGRLWSALLREPCPGVAGVEVAGSAARVRLADGRVLAGPALAPFARAGPGLAVRDCGGRRYEDAAALVAALPVPPQRRARFAAELADSAANLADAYAHAPPPPTLAALAALPADAAAVLGEQVAVAGHPLHPGCRTRTGMSRAQVRAYAPEHRPVVPVRWWTVPAGRWWSPTGSPPELPLHPWQAAALVGAYPWLRPTGRVAATRPLMSLRTVAAGDGTHLKLALDVQMTSAVRRVSAAALHNGPLLGALLGGLAGRLPGLRVLAEVGGGAACADGAPVPSLAYLRRVGPRRRPGEVVLPLGSLCADGAAGRPPLAVQAAAAGYGGDPVAFLAALLEVLLPPLVALLHAGVALEAHGQNTLVALAGGRPVRVYYRDFGGVRVSAARLRAAGLEVPPLRGDLWCEDADELRTTLAAAVGVVVGELVAVLGRYAAPQRCWAAVSAALAAAFAGVPGAAADEAAWRAAPLPVKATTAMRLADAPLANQWARMPYGWEGPW
ncbi:iron transporter [Pilimelia terevasa]|uniref:Iron transporter n=1 Tax=Pilimelia terevasa TaxID=53372 RepID=A0A8J3BQW3_9ACTN|nr:IucA/IucC family protein [Pilimelia terevasa]GGK37330.1 iron transporter [Pilimelia terevasa]